MAPDGRPGRPARDDLALCPDRLERLDEADGQPEVLGELPPRRLPLGRVANPEDGDGWVVATR